MTTPQTRTVLLADDDPLVVAMLEQVLVQQGWTVLTAANGRDAMSRHGDQICKVDLLITDLHMPYVDGHELAKNVRKICSGLPIIFISGDSVMLLPTEAQFPGHTFMKKPFLPSELLAQLRRLFPA